MGDISDETQPKKKFATRLFDLRFLRHESQKDVAAAVGVAGPTYGAWERGDRELKAETLVALAHHFGVTPNDILDFDGAASHIPHVNSRLETMIKLYLGADPHSQDMAMEILEYGSKARRPH